MSGFKRGEFREFRATERIHLGDQGVDIQKGDIVEFDGVVLKHGIDEHQVPRLRGAVKKQWLVPSSDTTTTYVPRPGGVQVHPADTGNPMDRKRRATSAMSMEAGGEEMVVSAPGFTDFTASENQERRHGSAVRGMRIEVEGNYDAVPVANLTPLAKRGERTALVNNAGVASNEINKLDSKLRKAQVSRPANANPAAALAAAGNLSPEEAAVLQQLLNKAQGGGAQQSAALDADDYDGPVGEAPWIKSKEEQEMAKAQADAERAARLASLGMAPPPVQAAAPEEAPPEPSLDDIISDDPPSDEEAENAAKVAMVQQLMPDFD